MLVLIAIGNDVDVDVLVACEREETQASAAESLLTLDSAETAGRSVRTVQEGRQLGGEIVPFDDGGGADSEKRIGRFKV